eukprot:1149094-Pelagomonas_calceolata.AAC.1
MPASGGGRKSDWEGHAKHCAPPPSPPPPPPTTTTTTTTTTTGTGTAITITITTTTTTTTTTKTTTPKLTTAITTATIGTQATVAIWSNRSPPICDICDPDDIQDEKHALLKCSNLQDGEKTARVNPNTGVKRGCPLSPLLFSLYINDIDETAEGVQGAVTGTAEFYVTHMLYADDLTLKCMSMAKSSEHATGPFMTPAFQVHQFVREKFLANRPYLSLWLGKTYAGQVWGTDLQVRHMSYLKSRSWHLPIRFGSLCKSMH